jgi:C-terminal processing protease CtpA/Prc
LQTESVNARSVDWDKVRTDVLAAAATATTIPAAYPAIDMALRALNDFESYYQAATGTVIGPVPDDPTCNVPTATPSIPHNIGYVKVASFIGSGPAAQQYAQALHQTIRSADRLDLLGWIVDLRDNPGGNPAAMNAGLGPILGEGTIAWLLHRDHEEELTYRGGGLYNDGSALLQVESPYTLMRTSTKVAVLTSRNTNSAGEHVAVSLRGLPYTRSFGTMTCGRQHMVATFPMRDGALLGVKFSTLADRLRRRYDGPIQPDETIADSASSVERAITWLQGQD